MSAVDFFRGGLWRTIRGGQCQRRTVRGGFLSAADNVRQADSVRQISDFFRGGLRWNFEVKVRGGPSASCRRIHLSSPKSTRVRRKSPPGPPEFANLKSAADSAADSGGLRRIRRGFSRTNSARYCAELGAMAWIHTHHLGVVLGPCAQY